MPSTASQSSTGNVQLTTPHRPGSNIHPKKKKSLIIAVCAFAFLLAALLAAAGLAYACWSGPLLLPGIQVAGTSLDGMDLNQAAARLNQTWNIGRKISLTDGNQTWQVDPASLGLWMDPTTTAGSAYAIGRGPDGYQQALAALQGGRFEVAPVIQFNREAARDYLTRWAGLLDRPAINATLRLEAGVPIVTPAEPGLRLDVERTLADLAADPDAVMASGMARVFFEPIPAQIQDVQAAEDQVRALLGLNLAGVVYDPVSDERISWSVPPDTIASWIRVELDQQGYQARLDEASLVDYLARLDVNLDLGSGRTVAPLADPAASAKEMLAGQALSLLARHLPGEYTVQGGETLFQVGWKVGIQYWRMLKANPGVNPNGLRAGQKLVVPSLDDQLPLPVVPNKRIVISISEQHMWVNQDGELFREFVISTGIDRSPTQPGIYQVQTHELNAYAENWDLYMPHWMGIYEAWPGFMNGIHGLPMLSSGVRLWKNVLGRPASYGCIILDLPEAEWLYNWAENGVVVEIRR